MGPHPPTIFISSPFIVQLCIQFQMKTNMSAVLDLLYFRPEKIIEKGIERPNQDSGAAEGSISNLQRTQGLMGRLQAHPSLQPGILSCILVQSPQRA